MKGEVLAAVGPDRCIGACVRTSAHLATMSTCRAWTARHDLRTFEPFTKAVCQVEDLVVAMDEALRPAAIAAAQRLRAAGRRVDLLLEPRKMKWVFKARCAWSIVRGACAVPAGSRS